MVGGQVNFKRGERVYWYEEIPSNDGPSGGLVSCCGEYRGMVSGSALVREAGSRRPRLVNPIHLMDYAKYMIDKRPNNKLAKILGFVQGRLNSNPLGRLSIHIEGVIYSALFRRGCMSGRDDFVEERQDLCDSAYKGFHIALKARLLTRQRRGVI